MPRGKPKAGRKSPEVAAARNRPSPGVLVNDPGGSLTAAEVEFGRAMDRFRREQRRPFPTCAETLAVLLSLGYRKVDPPPEG